MSEMRTETDSFGPLEVPAEKLFGAQTARSLINFPIGTETMPFALIRALGIVNDERSDPLTGLLFGGKGLAGVIRPIFQCPEQGF